MRKYGYVVVLFGFICFSACKKDNPLPSANNSATNGNTSPAYSEGSVSGTVTVDAGSAVTLSGAIAGASGYVISASNIHFPAYPKVYADFGSKPAKDSTYSLNSSKGGPILSIITSNDPQDQYYADTTGFVNVTTNSGQVTVTFSKVKFVNAKLASHNASGILTVH